jgi:hypothetical protein
MGEWDDIQFLAWPRCRMLAGISASAVVGAAIAAVAFLSQNKAFPQLASNVPSPVGAIAGIGPFQGATSEGFDQLGLTGAQQRVSIFGKTATVTNLTQGGALKIERSSSLNGVLVTPRSAPLMLGQLGISQWVFNPPLIKFGGYLANNSRFDDATVDFYDVSNALIGSVTASVPKSYRGWTWNGWQSSVPVHRLVVTGNDVAFLHGFIWFDDMQATPAPPPPCTMICPANIAVCNDPGQCGAVVRFPAPAATNCAGFAIGCSPPTGSFFPVGTNWVVCAAMDAAGHVTNSCSFTIVVNDCEPPVVADIAASPEVLWPPNRRMEAVTVRVVATDNCRLTGCRIISVTSSEPTPGRGSGSQTRDWQITGDLTVNLKAERSGTGTGRVYSITVECTDDAGNASITVAHVTVPHDHSPSAAPESPPEETQ